MKNEVKLEEITLEPQVARHATELFPLLSDRSVHEFTDSVPPQSEEELHERFLRLETRRSPDGTEQWLNWVIRRPSGEAVGYVQATVAADRTAEIAFVLGTRHWGQGLALAATTAMLKTLTKEFGVLRALATADAANRRSVDLLSRLGFAKVSEEDIHNVVFERELTAG